VLLPARTTANQAPYIIFRRCKGTNSRSQISSLVDYCNSILYSVYSALPRPLQSVLNAAAWLITRKQQLTLPPALCVTISTGYHYDNVLSLNYVHWCSSVYVVLHHRIWCVYMSSATGHHLRSVTRYYFITPRTRLIPYVPRSFTVSGAVIWNSNSLTVSDLSDLCDVL